MSAAGTAPAGFGAVDLQNAYNLSADGGAGQTIAIVDAFDDPTAEADLAVYRAQFGLPACTTANGCFRKVSQRGGTDYPAPDAGWAGEISLDLDMVSAAAPLAHILLVEADSPSFTNLGASVNEAVALGAKYVSNSYGTGYTTAPGSGEPPTETTDLDPFYNHPGVAVVASSGDSGFGVSYPASSQYVTAVGGTSLARAAGTTRGWSESVWHNGPGSGCSVFEPKPAFQTDVGCPKRTVADVSAVADPLTGVSVYQTFGGGGWNVFGGTSVASPIIAGVYASAGTPVTGSYPNSYPYRSGGAGLNDVTNGTNGPCSPAYLCTAGTGYDGPTGLGTPNGTAAFRSGPHGDITGTVTNATTGAPISGATVSVGATAAHTDATGSYSLRVSPGTYDIDVDAFAYASTSASGVVVADGGSVTKSFTLNPVPMQTVSGKVTDGSGHGWPLYAKIEIDGIPGGPLWTDPYTGDYTVDLPAGHDYSLHVISAYPGYLPANGSVSLGGSATTKDFSVPLDPWSAKTLGYSKADVGPTEGFDSTTSAPAGWSVTNADGTTGGWQFDDPGAAGAPIGNRTGGSGAFAIVDSDAAGPGTHTDSYLTSPVFDLTGDDLPVMNFQTDYRWLHSQATVDASTDGGQSWTTLWSAPAAAVRGPAKVDVPVQAYAHNPHVQFRFHYTGSFAWWWEIDNVFVGNHEVHALPGGLVAGTVTDANTSNGLNGVTVSGPSGSGLSALTTATPDDPGLSDGFYRLFSPAGAQSLSAAKASYAALSQNVNVTADSTTKAVFPLKAGQLTVSPDSLNASVDWGQQATRTVTVKNTGSAPADLTLGEESGGVSVAAQGAPLSMTKGDFSPLRVTPSAAASGSGTAPRATAAQANDSAWQPLADLPVATQDNAVAVDGGKLYSGFGVTSAGPTNTLYSYNPGLGIWTQLANAGDARQVPAHGFIGGKLYVAGGWGASGDPDSKLEIYDPSKDSWTTGASDPAPLAASGNAVLDGKLYAVGGCTEQTCGSTTVSVYDPSNNSWSAAADYPEPVSWNSCGAIAGKLFCAGGIKDTTSLTSAYVYDPSKNSWSSLPTMPVPLWGSAYTTANGQLLISSGVTGNLLTNQAFAFDPAAHTWSALPNVNTAAFRGGGASGFYKVGGSVPSGGTFVPTAATEQLLGFDQSDSADVTWLAESKSQVTIAPGDSAQVTVTFDASAPEINQPGTYSAQLVFDNDTPYTLHNLPVSFTVNPPSTWGKITGTVLGATSSGNSPLAGATVQISSSAATYTLATAQDGTYGLWLDAKNSPLTVIVSKDGYAPAVTTVKIKKGAVTLNDITLKRA
ncbi:carboxypeptidase regulatory-like domain-containing protein [Streptomyces sp. NPDC002619]|uniref:carboxypeptidase regulatory-like domain-containing protein n=1 Tax=Streptomyces sp. NPDC002619 TaxID=3364655 RepID=UPI0036C7F652